MLFLKTFGGLSVEIDGAPGTGAGQQRKTLALLARLAAAGRRGVSRDKLTAHLWPESDTEHSRNLLKQACFALRRDLHAPELILGAVELRLNPDVITSDIGALDDALARGDSGRAVAVYTGPFLDGFYLAGAAEFERWVETTRGALKARVADALEGLAQLAATNGDSIAAVKLWRQLVALDPLAARAALGLLRALIAAGERSAALEFGRVHENLVRQELGVAPDPAVNEFLVRLRSEGEPADELPTSSSLSPASAVEPTPAPRPAPRRRWRVATGASVLAVLAALIVATTRSGVPPLDANLFAVVPFGTADLELLPMREGLADLVSRRLDGALRLRSVPPTAVMRRWQGHADRVGAQELAHRTGAGLVLFGDLARVGRDSVRLHLTLFDAQKARHAEIERAAPINRIDRLADSVSLDVMRGLTPLGSWAFGRLASPGTRSLPALKAFLEGEDYLRRYWLDSAISSYARAIALDSTFAVALRHMAVAESWGYRPWSVQHFARAARFIRGLSPRDSLMVAYSAQPPAPSDPAFYRLVFGQEATLLEMIRRYPEDPELWHEIGDVQFHFGFVWQDSTWNRARRSFDGAIARDSGYALAYIHPVEVALNDNDRPRALRYVQAFLAIQSVNRDGAGMRLLSVLLEPEHIDPRQRDRELDTVSLATLRRVANAIRLWPDAEESQIAVARRLLLKARETIGGTGLDAEYALRPYESIFAEALIHRGHLREARRTVGNSVVTPAFMELAELGVIPAESVAIALDELVGKPTDRPASVVFPSLTEGTCYRAMDAALWWAARRDSTKLKRLVQREETVARMVDLVRAGMYERPVPQFARAALALARGDTTVALQRVLPDSTCPGAPQRRAMQFRLLATSGRDTEAAWVWDRIYDRTVPLMLERARVAERMSDSSTAIHYYQFVVQAWLHADPELQPVVAEAQSALRRLGDIP